MEKEIIIVGHPESGYAERLTDYINDNGLLNIQLIAFSSKSKYKEAVKRYNPKYKILAVEWKEDESSENTFYFCEEKEEEKEEYIFRYQAADRIAARIREVTHLIYSFLKKKIIRIRKGISTDGIRGSGFLNPI